MSLNTPLCGNRILRLLKPDDGYGVAVGVKNVERGDSSEMVSRWKYGPISDNSNNTIGKS